MIELDQLKQQLSSYDSVLRELESSLDMDNKKNRIQELEREMEAPDFWNDAEKSTAKTKELKSLKDDLLTFSKLEELYGDIEAYIELGNEEEDPDIVEEAKSAFEEFTTELESIRMKTLLSGEYDSESAIVTLHSGAGGTEACDWVSMLYRVCIPVGRNVTDLPWTCWTFWTATKPVLNP